MIARALGVLGLFWAAMVLVAAPALAQTVPAPPNPSQVDENGVDLLSGGLVAATTDVAIGPADHRGVRLARQYVKQGWRLADIPTISGSTTNPIVSFGGRSIPFKTVSGAYVPEFPDGSTLNSTRSQFVDSGGTVVDFFKPTGQYPMVEYTGTGAGALGSKVTYPDGVTWTFDYNSTYFVGTIPGCYSDPYGTPCYTAYTLSRLSSITSNTGYQVKLTYAADSATQSTQFEWWRITKATALNKQVEYCDPAALRCTFSNTWPEANYTTDYIYVWFKSAADPAGRTTNYTYSAAGSGSTRLTGIRAPGATSDNVTIGYNINDKVSTVTAAGAGTSTYSYGTGFTSVTHPGLPSRTIQYSTSGLVTSSAVGSQTTTFAWCTGGLNCPVGLLSSVTMPEGNKTTYGYDDRGNVTSTVMAPKPSVGGTPIMTTAGFDATCTNQKTCNKPNWTKTARTDPANPNDNTYRTDYTYDPNHGGLLAVTRPADASGVRAQVRFGYGGIYAYYKNSAGSIVAGPTPFYVPSSMSSCRTATTVNPASCVGSAEERLTILSYVTNGVATDGQPAKIYARNGDLTINGETALTYDQFGRQKTIDGPQAGTADVTFFNRNITGQVTGVISPDPDGGGAALYPAVKYNYLPSGQIDFVQSGTVSVQSDAGWSGFSELSRKTIGYDTYQRPIREVLTGGGSDFQVTDQRYDAVGRIECSIRRMDKTNWGALPASCSPPQPADRVTYNRYDTQGRVDQVQTGYYGTGSLSTETRTFTSNGKILTVTDAENNRTTFAYDGYDRLARTYFPVSAAGANASAMSCPSAPCDYEELGYDADGNVTSFRNRSAQIFTFTYDNLDRRAGKDNPEDLWDTAYEYDLHSNLTRAVGNGWAINAFTYDALGRLTIEQNYNTTTYHAYDVTGRQVQLRWGDGLYVDYVYSAGGALLSIRENGAASGAGVLASYLYDTAGRRQSVTRGNGTVTTYGYDGASRISLLAHDLAGTTNDVTTTYLYNEASQLASRTGNNDLYAFPGYSSNNRPYVSNGLNQLTSAGGTSIGYDARGNLVSSGSDAYSYSAENGLRTFGASTSMLYEPAFGQLLQYYQGGVDMRFAWSGPNMVGEINAATWTFSRRYVPGPGTDETIVWYEGADTSDRRWLIADERGSIVAVTNGSGVATQINKYDEYGIPAAGNLGRFQYTGQAWLAEAGLYYYKARMYSATLGRFMQPDPLGYGDGLNMYRYVGNDPINFVDPTGLVSCDPAKEGEIVACGTPCTLGDVRPYCQQAVPFGWICQFAPGLCSYGINTMPVFPGWFVDPSLPSNDPNDPSGPCGNGARINLSVGLGGTLFGIPTSEGLQAGGSASIEMGISIPVSSVLNLSLTGAQSYGSASVTGLAGVGAFAAGGENFAASVSNGPLNSSWDNAYEHSKPIQGGAAWGPGAEVSVVDRGSQSFAISGGPRGGYGGYIANGDKHSVTLAALPINCPEKP